MHVLLNKNMKTKLSSITKKMKDNKILFIKKILTIKAF
jgi:hypothetical protein